MQRHRHVLAASVCPLLAVVTVVACGPSTRTGNGTNSTPPATITTTSLPTAPTVSIPPSTTTSQPPPSTTDVRVYFLRGGKIDVAHRSVTATTRIAATAMNQLLSGTTPGDVAAGMTSAIPPGTRLLGLNVVSGAATVNLSGVFATGGTSLSMQSRLAQVVYTLTQFPTVTQVALQLDGQPVSVVGGIGLAQPVTRLTFPMLAPAALLEFPGRDWTVHSPIRLVGTAAVFEGQFQAELTNGAGHVLAAQAMYAPVVTSIGGPFGTEMAYPANITGPATLTLYDFSMKDGSRIDLVSIPLQLSG